MSPVGGFGGFNLSQIKPTGTDTSVGQSEKNSQEQAQVASASQNPAETSLAESDPMTPSEPNNALNSFDLADSNLSGNGGQLASLESGGGESLAGGGEMAADMAPEPAPEPVAVA